MISPIERRARLAAQIDYTLKRMGITNAFDINAFIRLAMTHLECGRSAATAFDAVRKSAMRIINQPLRAAS